MHYFENDGTPPAENAVDTSPSGDGQEDNHLDEGLTEEDEQFIEQVQDRDVDDMTADERAYLKELLGKAKTTIGQKKHYKSKFEEAAEQLGKLKPAAKPVSKTNSRPPGSTEQAPKNDEEKIRYQKIEFRQDNSSLSKEQVDEIFTYAALKRTSPEEALKTPFIKKYLEQSAADREVAGASGHPSSGGASHAKPKGEDYKSMDSKSFQARRSKIMRENRR